MTGWATVDTAVVEVLARQLTAAAANTAELAVHVGGSAAFHSASVGGACALVSSDSWQGPAAAAAASAADRLAQGLTALTWALGESAIALSELGIALAQAHEASARAQQPWAGESASSADQQLRAQAMAAEAADIADVRCAGTLADIAAAAAPLTRAGILTPAPIASIATGRPITALPGRVSEAAGNTAHSGARPAAPRVLAGSLHAARMLVVVPDAQTSGAPRGTKTCSIGWRIAQVAERAGRPTAVLRATVQPPSSASASSPSSPSSASSVTNPPVSAGQPATAGGGPGAHSDGYLTSVLAELGAALGSGSTGGALLLSGLVLIGGAVMAVAAPTPRALAAEIAWAERELVGLLSTAGCWQSFG